MNEIPDISEHLKGLLETVGITDYNATRSVALTVCPDTLEVTVYERNAKGNFILDHTRAGLFPRVRTHRTRVRT